MSKLFSPEQLKELASLNKGEIKLDFTNESLDIRKLGTIMGFPLYVDVGSIRDMQERNIKEFVIRQFFKGIFGVL